MDAPARIDSLFPSESKLIADLVIQGKQPLLSVIENLGPQLTDGNIEIRRVAIEKLSCILNYLPCDFLSGDEISYIFEFFSARFLDHHSLIPLCLSALKALSMQSNLLQPGAVLIANTVLNNQNFQVQSLRQPERLLVFQTLTNLFSFYDIAALCKNSSVTNNQLLFGFIQSVDGEKDPRNLLLVFDLVYIVASTFDLAQLGDELFDVVACYFPIDFTPPAAKGKESSTKFEITADDLRQRLRKFFACNPIFYLQAIPLIVEKLSSSLTASRLEAAEVLEACAEHYPASCFRSFLLALWDSLQAEIFGPVPAQSQHLVIFSSCLCSLVRKLTDDAGTFRDFYKIASTQLDRFISEPGLRFVRQSARVISSVLQGLKNNLVLLMETLNHYVDRLVKILSQQTDRRQRSIVLESLEIILSTELDPGMQVAIDDDIAKELLDLLLSFASTCCLLESDTQTASDSLKAISNLAKLSKITAFREHAIDVIVELSLMSGCHCKEQCASTVFTLVKHAQPSSPVVCSLLDKIFSRIEETPVNDLSNGRMFDLVVAMCQSEATVSQFIQRCSFWHFNSDPKFQQILAISFPALASVCCRTRLHRGSHGFNTLECVLKDQLTRRALASQSVRELIAFCVDKNVLLQFYRENVILACDVINVLSLIDTTDNGDLVADFDDCESMVLTVLNEITTLQPSSTFCFNLCAFLTKCLSLQSLEKLYLKNRELFDKDRASIIICFALFLRGSSMWTTAADSIINLLSCSNANDTTTAAISDLFGQFFSNTDNASNGSGSLKNMVAHASPLRKQALICRMAPNLATNVCLKQVNVIANLTVLTDLIKTGGGNYRSFLEPVWPSVIDQLDRFPIDRLAPIINLLRENIRLVLESPEAFRLLDVTLQFIFKTLSKSDSVLHQDNDKLLANDSSKSIALSDVSTTCPLPVRLASVSLLAELANYATDYALLLGPIQKRILRALKPCVSDRKRLVRSAAASAINRWSCS